MPRYFFHLYNDEVVMDDEGRELPDLAAAYANATSEARQMMTETVIHGRINFSHWIDVADEVGAVLATVTFRDAVTVDG